MSKVLQERAISQDSGKGGISPEGGDPIPYVVLDRYLLSSSILIEEDAMQIRRITGFIVLS